MEENRIYKGCWWLPSAPDDQVTGALTVETDGGLRLELYGGFGQKDKGVDFLRDQDEVIYGRCYDPNGHMKDISLFECFSSINLNFSSSFPIAHYSCRFALIGIHTQSMREAEFYEAQVSFDELAFWCPPKNITTRFEESKVTIVLDKSVENEVLDEIELENGITLKLKQGSSDLSDDLKVHIEKSTYLEVAKEGLNSFDVLEAARMFERFLALAMLAHVEHGKITLFSRNRCQTTKDGMRYYHPIELVTLLYKSVLEKNMKHPDLLFKYDDVADGFVKMYKRFWSDESIALIWSNLIDSLEKKRVFTSNDFLVVVQALDGFSIRFRKEIDLLEQLKALRNEFIGIKRLKLTEDDLKAARGSRNYYSHILKLDKKDKTTALDGAQLFYLTKKLRVLLICCVLNFLGLDNEKINELLNNCNNSILITG